MVEHARDVAGVFFHGRRSFACLRLAVRPQIRQDNAVTRGESLRRRNPEFMIYGKGVKQDDGWSVAQDRIGDLGISATNAIHVQILNARSMNRARPSSGGHPSPPNNTLGI